MPHDFLAGQETTALAMDLVSAGRKSQAAEPHYSEVDAVLGGRIPTMEDLSRLNEIESALLEAMRMYPPSM
jgi:hypothetical protein